MTHALLSVHAMLVMVAGASFLAPSAMAEVTLPSFFSHHMVVQREQPIPVWGWADPGEAVSVQLGHMPAVNTTADKDGTWKLKLPACAAGGPFTLLIKGRYDIRIEDVLVGEVWLCSGQSNMEWTVAKSENFDRVRPTANDGLIRQLYVPKRPLSAPDARIDATWSVCSPDTVGGFTACGYFMAREFRKSLKVPVGIINAAWGGTRIEPWIPAAAFGEVPALKNIALPDPADKKGKESAKRKDAHQQPTMLYNGMIHALVGYGMRGAIWYQGESNLRDGMLYTDKMKALIGGWRKAWDIGDFPFNFVQIAPFRYKEEPLMLPRLWAAQSAARAIPNVGMVVTNDIGTINDIHPTNKQDVGKRLALIALHRTYEQKDVEYLGPEFKNLVVEGAKLRLHFDNAKGLASRDGKAPTWFEIAGEDGKWSQAEAVIDGTSVVLSSATVAKPVSARFAWHMLAEPNLMNAAGLPAPAFTTETVAPLR